VTSLPHPAGIMIMYGMQITMPPHFQLTATLSAMYQPGLTYTETTRLSKTKPTEFNKIPITACQIPITTKTTMILFFQSEINKLTIKPVITTNKKEIFSAETKQTATQLTYLHPIIETKFSRAIMYLEITVTAIREVFLPKTIKTKQTYLAKIKTIKIKQIYSGKIKTIKIKQIYSGKIKTIKIQTTKQTSSVKTIRIPLKTCQCK
jgi:hypothetical protein